MSRTKSFFPHRFWKATAAFALTSTLATPLTAQVVSGEANPNPGSQGLGLLAPSPEMFGGRDFEDTGRPLHRSAGGSRSPGEFLCWDNLIAVVPLRQPYTPLPSQTQQEDCEAQPASGTVLTTLAAPTLWFYIPDHVIQPGLEIELKLFDASEHVIHTQRIEFTGGSGFISIPLAHPLTEGDTYGWTFSIVLNPNRPTLNPSVTGVIKRIAPPDGLVHALQATPDPQEQGLLYAEHGIWQDALTMLGNQRYAQPTEDKILTAWERLLSAAGWRAIAEAPITSCCTTTHLVQRSNPAGFTR
jgi:hypothetical protein